jgi:dipeptidyl-peptidase-4
MNIKKLSAVLGLLAAFVVSAAAQDKLLTLDEIFSPDAKVRVRFGGTPVFVQWAPDGRTFRQLINGRLMRVDAMTGQAVPYFDAGSLATALMRTGVKADEASKIANSPALQFNRDESAIVLNRENDLWLYDVNARSLKRLTNNRDEEKEEAFSPDSRYVSFVRGNNLFVVDTIKANEKQLTRDGREGDKAIYNGYLDWVYEEELYGRGLKRGYWWSPDSKYLAFLRLDESPVPKFIIPNDIPQDQDVETTFYPQAGDPNPVARIGIADIGKTTLLPNAGRIPKIGEKLPPSLVRLGDAVTFADLSEYKPDDLLIVRVAWSPDSRSVVFQAQNREQTFLDLNSAALNGKVTKLFTENSPAWVGVNDNPLYLNDGSFIWQSERDGWNHLYLIGRDGQMIRRLTNGKWEVRTVHGIDDANQWVYFSATKDSPVGENVYRLKIADGTIERLTQGRGWHSPSFNSKFTHFVDAWSDATTPIQTRLFKSDGSLERVINENRAETLARYKLGQVEMMQVKTRDGFDMEAMMIKPPDFDPTRKYPVLSYTYSGPHAPSVADRWGGNRYLWHQMMAQKGYIIWICDNRTASGKGLESTWPVYKRFGELELRDLEDGVSYLKSLPYVDGSRIGLWGWSYGGFMTSYALTHSEVFKIGMAGGTVSDWRNYDSIYTERYMLTPKNNPDGYDKTSVQKAAKNLNGRLLLIHGGIDDNVHVQNTTQLAYELQKADKQFDLMLYPTARHGLTNPAQIKHWYTMMTDHVLRNL